MTARLRPTTRKKIERIADELDEAAKELTDSRPFLSSLYVSIAHQLVNALLIPDSPFRFRTPPGSNVTTYEDSKRHVIEISSETFDNAKYHERLMKRL